MQRRKILGRVNTSAAVEETRHALQVAAPRRQHQLLWRRDLEGATSPIFVRRLIWVGSELLQQRDDFRITAHRMAVTVLYGRPSAMSVSKDEAV